MFPVERRIRGGEVLVIREATAADAAALLVHANALAEESEFIALGPGELNLTEAQEAEFLSARHTVDNAVFLVGVLDGGVVGSIDFAGGRRSRIQHTGELGMGVRKAHWRKGIGAALLGAFLRWARANAAITKVNLRVRSDNVAAIALYERAGFGREGTIRKAMLIRGQYYDNDCMGLDV